MIFKPIAISAAAALAAALLIASPSVANDPFALNDYAVSLMEKGDVEKAVESLQRAFGMYPYNEALRKNLAQAYAASGHKLMEKRDFEAAADRYDHARELFPENSRFLMMRGVALYWATNLDLARVELEKSTALKDDPDAFYYLGQVYYDTGDIAGAVRAWKKAQTLKPEDKQLGELIAKAVKELTLEPEMEKGASSRFAVTFDVSVKSDMVKKVLDELETAYNKVGSDLGYFPQGQIPVILYTRKSYMEVTDSPDWSGGVFDGKIRIPIGGLTEITPQFRAILVHEYTHAVIHGITKGNCPIWLNEGIAEYEGRKEYDPPLTALPRQVAAGQLLPLAKLEGSFMGLSSAQAALAYEESYAAVRFMISAYGLHKVKDLLAHLGQGKRLPAAFADAFADYQLSYETVENEWREHAKATYTR